MWQRPACFLLLAASLALADADTLVRRARVRLDHGNTEGARVLLRQALREDPDCGEAMVMEAQFSKIEAPELKLAWLEHGGPHLDLPTARRFLLDLRPNVVDFPEDVYLAFERAALGACGNGEPPAGPGTRGRAVPTHDTACGPLRTEAWGVDDICCRSRLRRIADRFAREGIEDAIAWSRLALLHRLITDEEAAQAALARVHPSTPGEVLCWAEVSLRIAEDPWEWWKAHEHEVLDALSKGGGDDEKEGKAALVEEAGSLLAAHRDLEGILRLADADQADDSSWRAAVEAIDGGWRLDEAFTAIEGRKDLTARCVRALLLDKMDQYDRARAELEEAFVAFPKATSIVALHHRLAPGSPEDDDELLALYDAGGKAEEATWASCWEATLTALRARRGPAAVKEAVERLLVTKPEFVWEAHWRYPGDLEGVPLQGIATAAVNTHSGQHWKVRILSDLCPLCKRAGQWDVLPFIVNGIPERDWRLVHYTFPWARCNLRDATRSAREVLLAFARCPTLSPPQEVALGRAYLPGGADQDMSDRVHRARLDLERDPAFIALPSAQAVLALVCDTRFQREERLAHEREAYARGARGPLLLADLAKEDPAVLPELEKVDPGEAHLLEALRSARVEDLLRFLREEDAAWPEQWECARGEAARRLARAIAPDGDPATKLNEKSGYWDQEYENWVGSAMPDLRSTSPDRLGGTLHEAARISPTVEAEVSAALRRQLRSEWQSEVWALAMRPPTSAADLIACAPFYDEGLNRLFEDYVGKRDATTVLREVIDGPRGKDFADRVRWARGFARAATVEGIVKEEAAAHPLDLRWHHLVSQLGEAADREKSYRVWLSSRTRELKSVEELLSLAKDAAEASAVVKRWFSLQRDESVKHLSGGLQSSPWTRCPREVQEQAIQLLEARCTADSDRDLVSRLTSNLKFYDVSARIDKDLLSSSDPQTFLSALMRRRHRASNTHRCEEDLRLIADPRWKGDPPADLWGWLVEDASHEANADLLVRALTALWSEGADSSALSSDRETREYLSLVRSRLDAAADPVPLWMEIEPETRRGAKPDSGGLDASVRLLQAGYVSADRWRASLRGLPPAGRMEACRRFLAGFVAGSEARYLGQPACELAEDLLEEGAVDEAISCVDLWADRAGPLAHDQREGPGSRTLFDRRIEDLPFDEGSAFIQCEEPPEALAAAWLESQSRGGSRDSFDRFLVRIDWKSRVARPGEPPWRLRLREEARKRWIAAEGRYGPGPVRDECRRARAGVEMRDGMRAEAIQTLFSLAHEAGNERLRGEARKQLETAYAEDLADRGVFVECYLASLGAEPPPSAEEVAAWAARLSSESPAAREEAELALRARGRGAAVLLRALREAPDPEVRARAEAILADLSAP